MMSQTVFVCGLSMAQLEGLFTVLGLIALCALVILSWYVISSAKSAKRSKRNIEEIEADNEIAPAPAPVAPDPEPAAVVAEATVPQEDEAEVAAAISAALAEYLRVPQSSFRVVSFKKAASGAHWNK